VSSRRGECFSSISSVTPECCFMLVSHRAVRAASPLLCAGRCG
jgi:hypothetical protein